MKQLEFPLNKPLKMNLDKVDVPYATDASVILDLPIPPALWTVNPRRLLGKKWWDAMRKKVYQRNNGFCLACGSDGRMEAHERYTYDLKNHISTFAEIIPLCNKCHLFIHWRGVDNPNKRRAILIHGMNLLKANHLLIPELAFRASGIWGIGFKTKLYITDEVKDSLGHPDWKLDIRPLQLTDKQIVYIQGTLPYVLGKLIIE